MEEQSLANNEARVKFSTTWKGKLSDVLDNDSSLCAQFDAIVPLLADVLWEFEQAGVTPVCADGKVGGNASVLLTGNNGKQYVLMTKSGKVANHRVVAADLTLVEDFHQDEWSADYFSSSRDVLPTSDAPLHWAASYAWKQFSWESRPSVILHGHALETEEEANKLGFPISTEETLFSTPEDTAALMTLFDKFPYPANKMFIRKGHGFVLLADSITQAMEVFEIIKPHVMKS